MNTDHAMAARVPELALDWNWDMPSTGDLEGLLPPFLLKQRWFGGKGGSAKTVRIIGRVRVAEKWWWVRIRVEGEAGDYLLALAYDTSDLGRAVWRETPWAVVGVWSGPPGGLGHATGDQPHGVLFDAVFDDGFGRAVLALMQAGVVPGESMELEGQSDAGKELQSWQSLQSRRLSVEQSNSAVIYGSRGMLKFFRKAENGGFREAEILRHLRECGLNSLVPRCFGWVKWNAGGMESGVAALSLEFRENQGDAWQRALDGVKEVVKVWGTEGAKSLLRRETKWGGLLGKRTAELHRALAQSRDGRFGMDPMDAQWCRKAVEGMEQTAGRVRVRLEQGVKNSASGRVLLQGWQTLLELQRDLADRTWGGSRIWVHGDYHLGQVLWTGEDFVVIDFEGEPGRSVAERLEKRPAMVDVAGMLRSFDYAARTVGVDTTSGAVDGTSIEAAMEWRTAVSQAFWEGYWSEVAGLDLMPLSEVEAKELLRVFLVEKAVYELGYELMYRPHMAEIPVQALLEFLNESRL